MSGEDRKSFVSSVTANVRPRRVDGPQGDIEACYKI